MVCRLIEMKEVDEDAVSGRERGLIVDLRLDIRATCWGLKWK